MKKVVAAAGLLALVGLVGWRVYEKIGPPAGQGRPGDAQAVAVEVAPVRRVNVRDAGAFTGSVVARSYFVVAPKIPGRLRKLAVDIGDDVEPGTLIASLDDDEYVQALEQARAELSVAKANVTQCLSALSNAEREYERARGLRSKQISSESELDAAKSRFEAQEASHQVALAQVAQKEAAMKAAEVRLSYTQIRAQWDGGSGVRTVGERFVNEGAMLAANAPIVSILDLDSVTVVVHVTERDYSRIGTGKEAAVASDALPGRSFKGKVVRVAPLLRESSRQARVEIDVPNPGHLLKPGMFARAEMIFGVHSNATVVPVEAIAKRQGARGVFLVEDASLTARFVPVSFGITEAGLVEVLDPALTGTVVTIGQHLLEDGSPVILPQAEGEVQADDEGPRPRGGLPAEASARAGAPERGR